MMDAGGAISGTGSWVVASPEGARWGEPGRGASLLVEESSEEEVDKVGMSDAVVVEGTP